MGRPARTVADRQLMQQVGHRLRWVRDALGKSQREMSDAVGLHQTTWSLYERGLRLPDQFEAVRLAGKLRISVAYMLEGRLEGVERALAIQLAARHPELAGTNDTAPRKGTGRP